MFNVDGGGYMQGFFTCPTLSPRRQERTFLDGAVGLGGFVHHLFGGELPVECAFTSLLLQRHRRIHSCNSDTTHNDYDCYDEKNHSCAKDEIQRREADVLGELFKPFVGNEIGENTRKNRHNKR